MYFYILLFTSFNIPKIILSRRIILSFAFLMSILKKISVVTQFENLENSNWRNAPAVSFLSQSVPKHLSRVYCLFPACTQNRKVGFEAAYFSTFSEEQNAAQPPIPPLPFNSSAILDNKNVSTQEREQEKTGKERLSNRSTEFASPYRTLPPLRHSFSVDPTKLFKEKSVNRAPPTQTTLY